MIKPVWKSKKAWAAALSLLGVVVAHYTANPQIALGVIVLGSALLTAIGLADLGKEGRAIEAASWDAQPEPEPDAADKNKIEYVVDVDTSQAEAALKKVIDAVDAVEAVGTPEDE